MHVRRRVHDGSLGVTSGAGADSGRSTKVSPSTCYPDLGLQVDEE